MGLTTPARRLVALDTAQMAFSMIRSAGQVIGSEFKRTADYVKQMASEFADLRKTMQEVATLSGNPEGNSNEFTTAQAKEAQKYGLKASEYRDFQAEFLNYADSQVGDTTKGAKLTEEQGQQYTGRVAALMKESGVNPAIGAELAGSLLENAQGPQDVDKLMEQLSRTFTVLEKGRVPLDCALPQLSRIMAYGVKSEEAAKMFSIVSPASPGEEGTSVEAAMRAIQKMKTKGTGEEFGVKQGMGEYAAAKAFSENINKRTQDLMAEGKTQKMAQDMVAKELIEKEVAADHREARGLVRGFGRQGIELGGFARYEQIEADTPMDFEAARKKRYEASDEGRHEAARIDTEAARIERSENQQDVMLELERGAKAATKSGELESGQLEMLSRQATGTVAGVEPEQQIINEETVSSLRKRAGVPSQDRAPFFSTEPGEVMQKAADIGWRSQESVNAEIKELLKKIAENTAKDEKTLGASREKLGAVLGAGGVGAALSAPPAGGANKRGA